MGKRKALLIGVGNYDSDSFTTLNTPPNNVAALEEILIDPQIGFFDEVNSLINPDISTMRTTIEDIFVESDNSDLVLLYFSGHGIKAGIDNKLYLTSCNTKKYSSGELKQSTAVSSSFIIDIIASCYVQRQIIILDSCFSGAFPDGILGMDDNSVDIQKYFGGEGRAILTSTNSTDCAIEKEGEYLSVYTKYLVEGLKNGIAAPEDKERITVKNIHDYVLPQVRKASSVMKPGFYSGKEGDSIILAKALRDPELTYRKKVELRIRIDDGNISATGNRILRQECVKLQLSEIRAKEIIEEALKPYKEKKQRNIQEYKIAFQHEVDLCFPFDEQVKQDLKDYQKILNLRDEDVRDIESKILETHQEILNIPGDDVQDVELVISETHQEILNIPGDDVQDVELVISENYQETLNIPDEDIQDINSEIIFEDSQFNSIKLLESLLKNMPKTGLPVTIVTGFLGSGKSTFINRILENNNRNISVIISESGVIDILPKAKTEIVEIIETDLITSRVCPKCGKTIYEDSSIDDNLVDAVYQILETEKKGRW